jgi:fatty acid amide hydrolase 2
MLRRPTRAGNIQPMREAASLQISARDLADRIRRRDLMASEAVEAHIRRIEAVNPHVNAVVAGRFDEARREAKAADRAIAGGDSSGRPLLGVPFTVKEMIAVAGMPFTFGCRNRAGCTSAADATVVARLRAAGAIVLGVTNVPEWGMWYETYNHVYGRTNNPYDATRTAGGSSGGEGAIIGAGGSPFGVAADIGGSIRMPAAFCGVYGHKPTAGLVPLTGQHPVYADAAARSPYQSVGPMARSARDLALLLRLMAGPDGIDPNAEPLPLHDAEDVDWRGRRVWLVPAPRVRLAQSASQPLRDAVMEAGRILEQCGAEVQEAPARLMERAGDIWFSALQSVGSTPFAELLGAGRRVNVLRESAAALVGRSEFSWPALFFAIGEALGRRSERSMRRGLAELERAAAELRRMVGDDGVLITPVHPRTAPRHNGPVLHPFDFLYTAFFNAVRVPATSVPFGFDANGLPLAVQVAAGRGCDHLTIGAAMALEAALPPWRPADVPIIAPYTA